MTSVAHIINNHELKSAVFIACTLVYLLLPRETEQNRT